MLWEATISAHEKGRYATYVTSNQDRGSRFFRHPSVQHQVQLESWTQVWRKPSSTSDRRATSWSRRLRKWSSRDVRRRDPSRSRAWSVARARTTMLVVSSRGMIEQTAARRKSTGTGSISSIRGITWRPLRRTRCPQVSALFSFFIPRNWWKLIWKFNFIFTNLFSVRRILSVKVMRVQLIKIFRRQSGYSLWIFKWIIIVK